eukprot:5622107-Amphidinium_carterae.2
MPSNLRAAMPHFLEACSQLAGMQEKRKWQSQPERCQLLATGICRTLCTHIIQREVYESNICSGANRCLSMSRAFSMLHTKKNLMICSYIAFHIAEELGRIAFGVLLSKMYIGTQGRCTVSLRALHCKSSEANAPKKSAASHPAF